MDFISICSSCSFVTLRGKSIPCRAATISSEQHDPIALRCGGLRGDLTAVPPQIFLHESARIDMSKCNVQSRPWHSFVFIGVYSWETPFRCAPQILSEKQDLIALQCRGLRRVRRAALFVCSSLRNPPRTLRWIGMDIAMSG